MERVHQLLAEGNLNNAGDDFWSYNWCYIASAKVPLVTKIAAYDVLKRRGVANINNVFIAALFHMVRADRTFVAALDLDKRMGHCYRMFIIWLEDDAVALARYEQKPSELDPSTERSERLTYSIQLGLLQINAPRCMRFLLQDKTVREMILQTQLSPVMQQLAEEFVQPTDQLSRDTLLEYGQSVKIIGMCVKDEELVAAWLPIFRRYRPKYREFPSVMLARKIHALATPDQTATIKTEMLRTISEDGSGDGGFELAWLFGLVGPFDPKIQACVRQNHVSWFPAFTFAIIVAMCDGYLKLPRTQKRFFARRFLKHSAKHSGILEAPRRFFTLVARLPMDLQALVALRLYGHTANVIPSETFDRAFLAII